MTNVISVKFNNRGKCYFFDPRSLHIKTGDKVIVETSKGLEIAECCRGCHEVEDTAVVQPLRPVIRRATPDDLRVEELNRKREREAFEICKQKIAEHGLDMKLVDVECNFEGTKTLFFFTSDGRVDFRELVKDLAGIFRNRIELRQIGVRDEAKMIGGLGICGRPYCCNQFLDDFQPVSTKMAKVQSLSLNPTKISGSCGRLMCCLRYEQDAYEDLIKHVPKQGAFVETKDGYGTAVQVNLLRQTVKVKLDEDGDDTLRSYKSNELCAVPGGRPKDGELPPSILNYVPEEEEDDELLSPADEWTMPTLVIDDPIVEPDETVAPAERKSGNRRRGKRGGRNERGAKGSRSVEHAPKAEKHDRPEKPEHKEARSKPAPRTKHDGGKPTVKPVKVDMKQARSDTPHPDPANAPGASDASQKSNRPRNNNRRRKYYHGKGKAKE